MMLARTYAGPRSKRLTEEYNKLYGTQQTLSHFFAKALNQAKFSESDSLEPQDASQPGGNRELAKTSEGAEGVSATTAAAAEAVASASTRKKAKQPLEPKQKEKRMSASSSKPAAAKHAAKAQANKEPKLEERKEEQATFPAAATTTTDPTPVAAPTPARPEEEEEECEEEEQQQQQHQQEENTTAQEAFPPTTPPPTAAASTVTPKATRVRPSISKAKAKAKGGRQGKASPITKTPDGKVEQSCLETPPPKAAREPKQDLSNSQESRNAAPIVSTPGTNKKAAATTVATTPTTTKRRSSAALKPMAVVSPLTANRRWTRSMAAAAAAAAAAVAAEADDSADVAAESSYDVGSSTVKGKPSTPARTKTRARRRSSRGAPEQEGKDDEEKEEGEHNDAAVAVESTTEATPKGQKRKLGMSAQSTHESSRGRAPRRKLTSKTTPKGNNNNNNNNTPLSSSQKQGSIETSNPSQKRSATPLKRTPKAARTGSPLKLGDPTRRSKEWLRRWLHQAHPRALRAIRRTEKWREGTWKSEEVIYSTGICQVHRVTDPDTKEARALKMIHKQSVERLHKFKKSTLSFTSEAEVMLTLQHPGILRLYNYFETEEWFCMVLEYVAGGNFLRRILNGPIPEAEAKEMFRSLCQSLKYLHDRDVVHRDLKPENILMEVPKENGAPPLLKLADFGTSRKVSFEENCHTCVGTISYKAPEVWKAEVGSPLPGGDAAKASSEGYGKPADLWSLGVILYMMLSGSPPFEMGAPQQEIRDATCRGQWEFDLPIWRRQISEEAKDAVRRMLVVEPSERITVSELLEHRWLAD